MWGGWVCWGPELANRAVQPPGHAWERLSTDLRPWAGWQREQTCPGLACQARPARWAALCEGLLWGQGPRALSSAPSGSQLGPSWTLWPAAFISWLTSYKKRFSQWHWTCPTDSSWDKGPATGFAPVPGWFTSPWKAEAEMPWWYLLSTPCASDNAWCAWQDRAGQGQKHSNNTAIPATPASCRELPSKQHWQPGPEEKAHFPVTALWSSNFILQPTCIFQMQGNSAISCPTNSSLAPPVPTEQSFCPAGSFRRALSLANKAGEIREEGIHFGKCFFINNPWESNVVLFMTAHNKEEAVGGWSCVITTVIAFLSCTIFAPSLTACCLGSSRREGVLQTHPASATSHGWALQGGSTRPPDTGLCVAGCPAPPFLWSNPWHSAL